MTIRLLLILASVAFHLPLLAQQITISGKITDANTSEPLPGVNVVIKGRSLGTTTDMQGSYTFSTSTPVPFTLTISAVGYQLQEIEVATGMTGMAIRLEPRTEIMSEVVFSASRVEESLHESPITIDKMDLAVIRQLPTMDYYDGIQNIKGVEQVTSGLTYKQYNTRGFNDTGNARILQLVDGVDNQTPGLTFSVGNLFGTSDLDVESVELIPGASSALYGPVAFNGVIAIKTKNPFQYQGISGQFKMGMNHFNETYANPTPMYDMALRYAKVIGNRFAFKLNASYFQGLDWYATNYTDVDPQTPPDLRGDNNPARDALNIYGDEVVRTLEGIGRVSRTGYEELHLMDYDVNNLKLNGALHYRLRPNMELSYQYNYGRGKAAYTGSSRFSINNFELQQHRLELSGAQYFLRGYATIEQSNDSYNTRSLGQHINRTWVRDLNGNLVSPGQADDTWFERYAAAYLGNIGDVPAASHAQARAFADEGRLLPGSAGFNAEKERIRQITGLQGAGIYSNSKLYHIEGQYDLSREVEVFDLLVGGNFRMFDMFTNGTLFDDADGPITITEYGAFVQAGKRLFEDRLKLNASLRYDKNQNFEGRLTPRASAGFLVGEDHHFRASFQTGFRNPTPGDQYIRLNVGPITILGGVPDNSRDLQAYTNSFTAASVGAFGQAFGQAVGEGSPPPQAVMQTKDLLVKSDVPYIKPEQVSTFEAGYRWLAGSRLYFDVNYYYSAYQDFILNTVVIEPDNPVLLPDNSINPAAAFDILSGNIHAYQLYTNASDRVSAQGVSAGLQYAFPGNFLAGVTGTWAQLDLRDSNPDEIPGFNTPRFRASANFGNSAITENIGFSVMWRWQDAFDWYGTFNGLRPGRIPAFSLFDAQVTYKMPVLKSLVKIGAQNLFNKQVYQAYGSPSIGGIYYVSLLFDELLR